MQLTEQQQEAIYALNSFIANPNEKYFILEGYAGTGKTTILKEFVAHFDKTIALLRQLSPNTHFPYDVAMTATTNKAVDVLQQLFPAFDCCTIHSLLGLTVINKRLVQKKKPIKDTVWVIDECSMIDNDLLDFIDDAVDNYNTKIIFVGDSTQLPPVGCSSSPVFERGHPSFKLTELIRQKKGELADLCTALRISVEKQELTDEICIDDIEIQHLPYKQFMAAVEKDMSADEWTYSKSKYIAYTNAETVRVNNRIKALVQGNPRIQKGDHVVNNKYFKTPHVTLKTDEMVYVSDAQEVTLPEGIDVTQVTVKGNRFYVPHKYSDLNTETKATLIDLRPMYACTVHKAQGSTFETVYININDIKKSMRDFNMFLRLLYVAVSRASKKVVFTGDF